MVKGDWVLTRQIIALLVGTFSGFRAHECHHPLWFAMVLGVVLAMVIDVTAWVIKKLPVAIKKT